jgi:hypothetical protein
MRFDITCAKHASIFPATTVNLLPRRKHFVQ